MATSLAFGQQIRVSHRGKQIWLSFYSCWGTKATKSLCYEHLNFEQPTCKATMEWKEGSQKSENESRVRMGWTPSSSARNGIG